MGPVAFLAALPLARRFGWFWAEIPGHVRERAIGSSEWTWESGHGETRDYADAAQELRKPVIDFVLARLGDVPHAPIAARFEGRAATHILQRVRGQGPEMGHRAVGQHDVQLEDMIDRFAVKD